MKNFEETELEYKKNKETFNSLAYFAEKIERLSKENAQMISLLQEVLNDDGSRYNQPGYYFKIKNFLDGRNKNG